MNKLLVPLVLIVVGLVGLLAFAVIEGGVPEIQTHQLADAEHAGRTVRMHGILHRIVSADRPLRFIVRDKERPNVTVPVYADRTRPDTFKETFDIAVDGRWDETRKEFVATNILTKCPSKYEAEEKQGYGSKEALEKAKGAPADTPATNGSSEPAEPSK